MRSILDELKRELGELQVLVDSIEPVRNALARQPNSLLHDYLKIRRRFDYAAFIVALYASFEKYIEDLVVAFAQLESKRLPYSKLPSKLVEKHLTKTAEILSPRARVGEGKYAGLTTHGLVKNLYECLQAGEDRPYNLNAAAVVAHDGNLRAGVVNDLFAALGIEKICELVRSSDALLAWYCTVQELEPGTRQDVPFSVIEERIRDIVERRNQTSHRGTSLDFLGVQGMSEAVRFLEAFSESIYAVVVKNYLHNHYTGTGKSSELRQKPGDGPFREGMIVVVEKPAQRLFVGQPIYVLLKAGARWGRVRSIQVNESPIQFLESDTPALDGVGLGLDFKCPKGADLFALAAEDDIVWAATGQ